MQLQCESKQRSGLWQSTHDVCRVGGAHQGDLPSGSATHGDVQRLALQYTQARVGEMCEMPISGFRNLQATYGMAKGVPAARAPGSAAPFRPALRLRAVRE